MATRTLYPSIAPSLDLNFAGSKTLDPRISFGRASAAIYYDGKTVAKAEENIYTYSQDFSNGIWVKNLSTVVSNSTTAPDGTATASKFVSSPSNGYQYITQSISSVSEGSQVVISLYAKASEYTKLQISNQSSGNLAVRFDLVTGSVISSSGTNFVSASAVSFGSGWYRCVVVFNKVGTVLPTISGYPDNAILSSYAPSYTGDGTSGIYIWGAQLEQRSQVTAYTPTTTQPITNYIPVLQTTLAGVPRFDHNPVTGESLGLLVEEQRTNLLTRSQEFDILWGKIGSAVLTNILVSPDGTLSADKIIADTTSSSHRVDSGVVLAQNSSYTFSCFAKVGEYGGIAFNVAGGSASATYNLIAGTVTGAGGTVDAGSVSAAIQPVGNGWYRCILSFTWLNAAITNTSIRVCLANSATNTAGQPSFTGDGYSGIYIWGAQLEDGSFPTSYIKTEASQVTRAADSASITGANFSSWYRQDEGTFIYKNRPIGFSPTDRYHFIVSETSSILPNSISSRTYNASGNAAVYLGSNPQSIFFYSGIAVGKENSIALAYKTNDFAFSTRGSTAVTDTSGVVPNTLSRFDLLGNGCQHMARITYYPKRLTDAQLQALTA